MSSQPSESAHYIGSILFFKHVILATLILMIVIPTGFAIYFGIQTRNLSQELSLQNTTSPTIDTSLSNSVVEEAVPAPSDIAVTESTDSPADVVQAFQYEVPDHQYLYPDMICATPLNQSSATDPTVYLTFDDGPSIITSDILDILAEHGVTATFFLQGKYLENEEMQALLLRAVEEGHSIGVHTYSHNYDDIYSSVSSFLDDFYLTYEAIYEITGVAPTIFRFPGGSINPYNARCSQEIISEMLRRGFVYFDWNESAEDSLSRGTSSVAAIITAATDSPYDRTVILLHDSSSNGNTAKALPGIIERYLQRGYQFQPLTRDVTPVVYNYITY